MAEITKTQAPISTENRPDITDIEGVISQPSPETQTSLRDLSASTQEHTLVDDATKDHLPHPEQATTGKQGMQSAYQPAGGKPTTAGALITQLFPYRAESTDGLVQELKRAA